MENKKGYIVLEVGYEYNDEYYHTGNYGEMYEAPKKVFLNEENALIELKEQTIKKLRNEDLGRYGGDGLDGICKKGMQDQFCQIFKEEFNIEVEDWEIEIPQNATNEQLEKIYECLKISFFKLVEVDLN